MSFDVEQMFLHLIVFLPHGNDDAICTANIFNLSNYICYLIEKEKVTLEN